MKCVCPMGGDRTCPDDCLLALWANMPPADRKAQRKPIAEKLYKQNFTMEQIATQLGVTTWTISKDLKEFSPEVKTSRPKGGRPKGSKPKRKYQDVEGVVATLVLDEGKTHAQVRAETGVSDTVVRHAVAREEGRREAEPTITPDMLSMSAQKKLDSAVRQHKEKLDADFHKRVNARVQEFLMDTILPQHRKEQGAAKKVMEARRGIMDKATFNKIRRGLHPDSRNSISDKVLSEAFDAFMALEKRLLNEENSPTTFQGLPEKWEDWEKMRRKPTSHRKHAVSRR